MKKRIFLLMVITLLTTVGMKASTPITLAKGSKAGLYISYDGLKSSDNFVDNACLTFDDSGWTSETALNWKDLYSWAGFYAYCPYIEEVKDAQSVTFSVREDQSTASAITASDFLYGNIGANPQDGLPKLPLRHLFSKLVLTVQAGDGFTDAELSQGTLNVIVKNVCTRARINLENGDVRSEGTIKDIKACEAEPLSFSAVVVPQRVGKLSVVWNNIEYVVSVERDFGSGKVYTLTATLKKTSGGINISIGGWEDSGEDFGGTVN